MVIIKEERRASFTPSVSSLTPSVSSLPAYEAQENSSSDAVPGYLPAIPERLSNGSVEGTAPPTEPIKYTFKNWQKSTLQLVPPPMSSDQKPLYNISVELNLHPFEPLGYVTTLTRGDERNVLVGGFEIAIHQRDHGHVTVGDTSVTLDRALHQARDYYLYSFGGVKLYWEWQEHPSFPTLSMGKCFEFRKDGAQVATFVPPQPNASPPKPPATLTVLPDGHTLTEDGQPLIDHIVISVLVIERRRGLFP